MEESIFLLLFVDHKVVPGDMSQGSGDLGDVRWGAIAQNQAWPIPNQPGHSQSVRTCDVPQSKEACVAAGQLCILGGI